MKFVELQKAINSKEIKGQGNLDFKFNLCNVINEIAKNEGLNVRADYEYGDKHNTIYLRATDDKGYQIRNYYTVIEYTTTRELVKNKYYWHESEHTAYNTLKEISFWIDDESLEINDWVEECVQKYNEEIQKQNDEVQKLEKYIKDHPEFVEMYKSYKRNQFKLSSETKQLFW